jgi:hypothetical protein
MRFPFAHYNEGIMNAYSAMPKKACSLLPTTAASFKNKFPVSQIAILHQILIEGK